MKDTDIEALIEDLRERQQGSGEPGFNPLQARPDRNCRIAADLLGEYLDVRHELRVYRQDVSDAVRAYISDPTPRNRGALEFFIIPAPDPLAVVLADIDADNDDCDYDVFAKDIRDRLDALGLEIREKNGG